VNRLARSSRLRVRVASSYQECEPALIKAASEVCGEGRLAKNSAGKDLINVRDPKMSAVRR